MSNAIQFDLLHGKLLCNDQPIIDAYTTQNEFEAYQWSTNKRPKDIGIVYRVNPFEILPGCWCSIVDFTGQSIVFGCTAHQHIRGETFHKLSQPYQMSIPSLL
jgi:hypothetical protein